MKGDPAAAPCSPAGPVVKFASLQDTSAMVLSALSGLDTPSASMYVFDKTSKCIGL